LFALPTPRHHGCADVALPLSRAGGPPPDTMAPLHCAIVSRPTQ